MGGWQPSTLPHCQQIMAEHEKGMGGGGWGFVLRQERFSLPAQLAQRLRRDLLVPSQQAGGWPHTDAVSQIHNPWVSASLLIFLLPSSTTESPCCKGGPGTRDLRAHGVWRLGKKITLTWSGSEGGFCMMQLTISFWEFTFPDKCRVKKQNPTQCI